MRETLRQSAPISSFARESSEDRIIGGQYEIKAGTQIACLLTMSQQDPEVWGPDADQFNPDRMVDGEFDRIQKEFAHSWSPFGTGMRACIGRPFAWQELLLAFAVLLQNFNFVMANPSYALRIAQTLTIKPKDFYVRAIPRHNQTPSQMEARLVGSYRGSGPATNGPSEQSHSPTDSKASTGKKIAIYYGSSSGTCEFMAQRLASDAGSHGFRASVAPLDAAMQNLPRNIPAVIVASSYEGQPPHNAALFVDWIGSLTNDELKNVSFAVWGCGMSPPEGPVLYAELTYDHRAQ